MASPSPPSTASDTQTLSSINWKNIIGSKLRWWLNRKLRPVYIMGIHDPTNSNINYDVLDDMIANQQRQADNLTAIQLAALGKYFADGNQNDGNIMADLIIVNESASVASKEWTVTAVKKWRLLFLTGTNATRANRLRATITPSGGSETIITQMVNTCSLADRAIQLLGAGGITDSGAENGGGTGYLEWLDAGDKIKIYDDAWVASDNVDYNLGYVEVDA